MIPSPSKQTTATPLPAPWTPTTPAEKESVREQLGRILSSATFRNSKRFPPFLRFTVEHALVSSDALKERTIGAEVFGRDPGYDTGQDPVVRMTAAEVRKRLAQYYQLPEHSGELLIAYQPGSYVPDFFPVDREAPVDSPGAAVDPPPPAPAPRWRHPWITRRVAVAAALVVALIGVAAFAVWRRSAPLNAVDRFWAPFVNSAASVLICIGDPTSGRPGSDAGFETPPNAAELTVGEFLVNNSVRYTDAVTLGLLTGELRTVGKSFRIRRPASTELKDLRDGPVILIGGFNNPWTLRLSEGLRFTLATDATGNYIRDRERPTEREWRVGSSQTRLKDLGQTYGLITRMQDPDTGQWVLAVSGLLLGTRAAGECILDAGCLESAEARLTPQRPATNLQVVVSATVIGEDSGAPQVVAAYAW